MKSKKEQFWNYERYLFHLKSSFRSWDIQILEFSNLKFHVVMKRVKVTSHQCDYFHHFKVSSNLYGKYASESRYTNLNPDNTAKLKLILMLLIFIKENEKREENEKSRLGELFKEEKKGHRRICTFSLSLLVRHFLRYYNFWF